MAKNRVPTLKDLKRWQEKWQKELRLQDWDVKVTFGNRTELRDGIEGHCEVSQESKAAKIVIMSPAAYQGMYGSLQWYDPENVLVHELNHIHWDWVHQLGKFDHQANILLEQALESVCPALIRLDRRSHERSKPSTSGDSVR